MTFEALSSDGETVAEWTVYSVGGGALMDGEKIDQPPSIYPLTTMEEILTYCQNNGKKLLGICGRE